MMILADECPIRGFWLPGRLKQGAYKVTTTINTIQAWIGGYGALLPLLALVP
jgi:hypothetical protein